MSGLAFYLPVSQTPSINASLLTKEAEFPFVFNGIIRAMDSEKFHIYLTTNTKPFLHDISRTIPYVYWDKLAEELKFL